MKNITSIHQSAMEKTDYAVSAKLKGDIEAARALFNEAFLLEKEAAMLALQFGATEPTRSILLRSAASLALDAQKTSEAEKLVCTALANEPPADIANELRDLLEQVHFQRHLDLRGITLSDDEVQMSIAGEGVGFGITPTELFTHRITKTENLIYRTAERTRSKPYREAGPLDKSTRESVALYMSTPRAASFAVTFRVGQSEQMILPGLSFGQQVIDEMLGCLEIFISGDQTELKKRIPDQAYYNNFIGLARSIAPDGKDLNLVGFTTTRNGKEKRVAITRNERAHNINPITPPKVIDVEDDRSEAIIIGVLRFADSVKAGKDIIKIVDDENAGHKLTVPEGMMSDIVKPLWNTKVVATGRYKGKQLILEDIEAYTE
ncbi:MAG: hypothetical protein SFT92_05000 [Rickettsiales bacterium]|nr:hypothetical protein [Rickettsiales bacterium]